jgi:hypothetical protein
MILQGHCVDNCSLRFCSKGRQLDLGESRSLTQFSQWTLQPVSLRFLAYAYAFRAKADGDDGDGYGTESP